MKLYNPLTIGEGGFALPSFEPDFFLSDMEWRELNEAQQHELLAEFNNYLSTKEPNNER